MDRSNIYVNSTCNGIRIIEHITYSSKQELQDLVEKLAKKYFLLEEEIRETIKTKGVDLNTQRKMYFLKNQSTANRDITKDETANGRLVDKERTKKEHMRIVNKKNNENKIIKHDYTYDYHLVDFKVYKSIRDLSKEHSFSSPSLRRDNSKLSKKGTNRITKVTIEDNKQFTFSGKSNLSLYSKNIPPKASRSKFLEKFITISSDHMTPRDRVNPHSRILAFRREFLKPLSQATQANSKSLGILKGIDRDTSRLDKPYNRSTSAATRTSNHYMKLHLDASRISESKRRLQRSLYRQMYPFEPQISKKAVQTKEEFSDKFTNFLSRQNKFNALKSERNIQRESLYANQYSYKPQTYSISKTVNKIFI